MKFNENLAAIHAYLCADGYVIKNPPTQKLKYYKIGLRNTNLTLLKDFQEKFEKVFGIKPHLAPGQRCSIGSKDIYEKLTKQFGSFYSWKWQMPKMSKKLSKIWLRAYFDCEGWVFCKSHQNRHVGIECVNKIGIYQIKNALTKLNIASIIKKRTTRDIYSLNIYGKENIVTFQKKIGFLHPSKNEKLQTAIKDFVEYDWKFPKEKRKFKEFLLYLMKLKAKMRKDNWIVRVISNRENNLQTLKRGLLKLFNIESRLNRRINGIGTIYYELSINKKDEVVKLINLHLLNKQEEEKWSKLKK